MMNLKLLAIANFIDDNDIVLDIGTDHGYLPIYLKENRVCKEVYASDIHENALNGAINNFNKKNLNIKTYLSDGFKNIENDDINTVVIAGVGTNTVLDIIKYAPKNINKYIISSNNNHYELRKKLYNQDLYIQKELIIEENNKFYIVDVVTKNKVKENSFTLKFGKSNNIKYFTYLLGKEKEILNKIPKKNIFDRMRHKQNIKKLKKIIKRNSR